ncbi:TetR/AcrR family transcriptional regulator [Janthinobacterium agaricidamnosum]|uniref:Bacterial regulatory s, tetR family protein n=1 Tax=Janthinobacterium agaricidamnosum NBRC 102515 = DSM 9628 TaxID=1349767 RepID=W0V3W0_9BURK|nr:TetR/AcrR family transcriptional regulator [Janthinobacterium agaricidamnosum]CDG83514.1 bacterial regulatory s, tetR family protein [Janthinobacterium agaricidamnosum NBRC 102515 = DSM 9628]
MKVSREQAALNRERIVNVAAKLFREHGYDGIGVADLMKNAGLTHGGFYGHFASKEDLMTEACQHALKHSVEGWRSKVEKTPQPEQALANIIDGYLTPEHRDNPGYGCPVAALGPDVARLGSSARPAFTHATRKQFEIMADLMPDGSPEQRRQQAIHTYASMVGAMVLSRSVDDDDFSREILSAVSQQLEQLRHRLPELEG